MAGGRGSARHGWVSARHGVTRLRRRLLALRDEPVEVSVGGRRSSIRCSRISAISTTPLVTIRFARGGLAVTHVSRTSPFGHDIRCEVVGTEGSVFVRGPGDGALAVIDRTDAIRFPADYRARFKDAYVAELTAFALPAGVRASRHRHSKTTGGRWRPASPHVRVRLRGAVRSRSGSTGPGRETRPRSQELGTAALLCLRLQSSVPPLPTRSASRSLMDIRVSRSRSRRFFLCGAPGSSASSPRVCALTVSTACSISSTGLADCTACAFRG